jgi:hypothetical protein
MVERQAAGRLSGKRPIRISFARVAHAGHFSNSKKREIPPFYAVSTVNRFGMSLAKRPAMQSATFATILAGIGVSFSLLVPRVAEACWTCTTDDECPTGFTCDENVGCMPTVDCQADTDCGAGMRCVTQTATVCTSPAAQTGGSADSTCQSVNACAPLWQAGCGKDSDCGDGFSCVENGSLCNSLGCSTLAQCQPKESDAVACNTDSDCPSCWSCLDASDDGESCINPGGPANASGGVNPGGPEIPADAGTSSSSGSSGSQTGSQPTLGGPGKTVSSAPKVCRPPYWGLSVSYAGLAPTTPVDSTPANICPNIEATRAGYAGLDPKSGSSGSSGGCSIGTTQGSNDSAPLWSLGAALAGIAVFSRRKRANAKS